MPAYARGDGHSCPTALGIFAQGVGHAYPCTWSCVPVYVGMRVHVRGYGYSCTCAGSTDCGLTILVDTFLLYQLEK